MLRKSFWFALIRCALERNGRTANLWMRIDRKGSGEGFWDNAPPIRDKKWRHYEIIGGVANDATQIDCGIRLYEKGPVWIDDVYLNAQFSLGHHEFANSANNGQWGEALIKEFIPALEKEFGGERNSEWEIIQNVLAIHERRIDATRLRRHQQSARHAIQRLAGLQ